MYSLKAFAIAILVRLTASQGPKQEGYLGFNSGATLDGYEPKQQSDFEKEFRTAQGLQGSPGKFSSIRLYTNIQAGSKDDPISAFPAAVATNTSLLLGLWCSGTDDIANELNALKSAIDQHGQQLADLVLGISVGSEDLYRISAVGLSNDPDSIGASPDTIVDFIDQVRKRIADTPLAEKPVGHADTSNAWGNTSNSAVIDAVDFVGVNVFPYYEKEHANPVSNASGLFDDGYAKTVEAAGDKPVWVTETGWPVSGPDFNQGKASVDNAKSYWGDVGCDTLFGRTNVWWYTLRDANPENKAKFAITQDLATAPSFNLTCPADSDAPAAVNNDGGGGSSGGGSGGGNGTGSAPSTVRVTSTAACLSAFVFASLIYQVV